jgi:hypothetical protein
MTYEKCLGKGFGNFDRCEATRKSRLRTIAVCTGRIKAASSRANAT